jgi:peptidylprolyl isomerase
MLMVLVGMVLVPNIYGEDAVIEDGKKVKFDYTLTIDGEQIETSEGKEPLEFTQGEGLIIQGLADAMQGMKVGETKSVTLTPENAYGVEVPEAYKEFPKSTFPEGFEFQKGMIVELRTPEGQAVPGIIWEDKGEAVVVNFNHPLAGKTLTFDVKVVGIE